MMLSRLRCIWLCSLASTGTMLEPSDLPSVMARTLLVLNLLTASSWRIFTRCARSYNCCRVYWLTRLGFGGGLVFGSFHLGLGWLSSERRDGSYGRG